MDPQTSQQALLSAVESFIDAERMTATQFGVLAVHDGKFVGRLRAGKNMTLATMQRAWDFMAAYPRRGSSRGGSDQSALAAA